MPWALRYTDKALADLAGIKAWLTQPGSGGVARKRLISIRTAINRLPDNPYLFPVCDTPGVRELPCDGGYRAFYELRPSVGPRGTTGDVLILRVFGPGQSRAQS